MLRECYAFCWLIVMAVRQAWSHRKRNALADSSLMDYAKSGPRDRKGSPVSQLEETSPDGRTEQPEVVDVPVTRGSGKDRLRASAK